MTPSEKDQSKSKGMTARRSKRVTLAIPIVLIGEDSSGNEFQESTRTTVVSKHGAEITTTRELVHGAVVTIENRSLALAATATVVSIGKRRSPGEPGVIGVQLIKAANVWGIIFPPDDWGTALPLEPEGENLDSISAPAEATAVETSVPAPTTDIVQPAGSAPDPTPDADILSPPPPEPMPPTTGTFPVPATLSLVSAATPGTAREKIDAITAAVLAKVTTHLDEAVDGSKLIQKRSCGLRISSPCGCRLIFRRRRTGRKIRWWF